MSLYDEIGANYSRVRGADERVTRALLRGLARLDDGWIVDVGSGAGDYARALADEGLRVATVEPSEVMLAQATPHPRVHPLRGVAERLPLRDGAVAGAVSVIATHHFRDRERALEEMDRVTGRGPVVIVTGDVRLAEPYWFHDYFGATLDENRRRMPPLDEQLSTVRRAFGRDVHVDAVPIPRDFADLFCGAAWSRPELYLEPEFRASQSSFALVDGDVVDAGARRLAADLGSGAFGVRYPDVATRDTLDLGLRVLTVAADTTRP